jgi:5-methylcytosine-specific restriction endonuclease McrA
LVYLACRSVVLVPAAQKYRRKYCSQRCAASHYNTHFHSGPRNGRWRGGKVLSYGAQWKLLKERVRFRDRVCRRCGKTPEQNGRALDVHHIKPYRFSGDHSLDNLVALCRSCHMRADDHGRRGSARFAGPIQLSLRPVSQRTLRQQRGREQRTRRARLRSSAILMRGEGKSLRQIARALGVSHQTIANWLSADEMGAESPSLSATLTRVQ